MDRDRIIEKIKKCLALGRSCEPHEAALAMKRARELMEKHGVTMDDVDLSEVSRQRTPMGKTVNPPRYQYALIHMVKRVFGCESVLEPRYTPNGWRNFVSFIGFGPAPEIAGYAFEVLFKQITRDRKAYLATLSKRLKRATKTRRGDLWADAWVLAASSKVSAMALTQAQKDLIAKWQAGEYSNLQDSKPRPVKFRGRGDHDAVQKGIDAGRNVTLHHGMDGTENTPFKIGM